MLRRDDGQVKEEIQTSRESKTKGEEMKLTFNITWYQRVSEEFIGVLFDAGGRTVL